jgi:hypothetical protein
MQHAAIAAEDEAQTATMRARTLLGAARAAVRAAEEMLEKHAAAAQAAAERRAQGEIDEAALQSSTSNFSPSPCGRGSGEGAVEQIPPLPRG